MSHVWKIGDVVSWDNGFGTISELDEKVAFINSEHVYQDPENKYESLITHSIIRRVVYRKLRLITKADYQ
jgi:hypothetical protein